MEILLFAGGLVAGALIVFLVNHFRKKELDNSFRVLSQEIFQANSQQFLDLANQTLASQSRVGLGSLDEKKKLIDQSLEAIKHDLLRVERSVSEFDLKREKSFSELSTQLKNTAEQTSKLQNTASLLQNMLANSRVRGQWGERIAEDVLQLVGFVENVDYTRQQTQDTTRNRPDFTFLLPFNRKVNMDSKFPFDNYQQYMQCASDLEKEDCKKKFFKSVRDKIKEITSREYINIEESTVDYAIMFVPNEQVFTFLHEYDPSVFDEALKQKVIICSPVTLFAILCVIREAVKVFKLQKTTNDIIQVLGAFNRQWNDFKKSMDRMGERIGSAAEEYGKLVTTRTNKLEVQLRRIDELQKQGEFAESSKDAEPLEINTADDEC